MMETYNGWANVPPHLKTKTTLKKEGLRLKRGQQHVAWVETRYGSKRNDYKLYDVNECIPAKPATEKQLEAIEKAKIASLEKRTCKRCGFVEELGRNYRDKWKVDRESGLCPGCQRKLMWEQDHDAAIDWAKSVLTDSRAVILDCETTNLEGEIIELAIINMQGETLFNRRFKPINEITPGAQVVHDISMEMLADEPSFDQYAEELRSLLTTSRVLIYNFPHDSKSLSFTCKTHEVTPIMFMGQCVMQIYAEFYGDWSERYKDYRWQPLNGGHDALGDCVATLHLIQRMAESKYYLKQDDTAIVTS